MPSRELLTECVRVSAFAMHAGMAITVSVLLFACQTQLYTNNGYDTVTTDWQAYKLQSGLTTCNTTQQCNRQAFAWIDDEPLPHHRWNPYACVVAFEFISASFALFYLRELRRAPRALQLACLYAPHGWNLVGLGLYLGWFASRGMDNWCEMLAIIASYGLATVLLVGHDAWRAGFETCAPAENGMATYLRKRLAAMTRYGEYTATASLLYVAVLSVFVVGPPSWAFVAGFAGIFACNVMGLGLHLLHTGLKVGPWIWATDKAVNTGAGRMWHSPLLRLPVICPPYLLVRPEPADWHMLGGGPPAENWRTKVAAVFGVGTWHALWVSWLELLKGAWVGLAVGMTIVIYFGYGYLFNTAIPGFVIFSLWNLVITYALFGVVATFFYAYDRYWEWLEPALDVLSVSAKVPIAASVCVAFLQMPGGSC